MRILVTGAGGPAGVGTIKALQRRHFVVAVDSNNLAPGLYLANRAFVVPPSDNAVYLPKVLEICTREHVSLVIPTVGEELALFSNNKELFQARGIIIVISNPKSIEIANNKLNTYTFFRGKKYCPDIYSSAKDTKYPCVVKPINSRGSRGFYICDTSTALELALCKNEQEGYMSIVMERLRGTEYSVYGLSDLNGKPLVSIANKRIRAVGESKVAKIVFSPELDELASKIAQKLNLVGPWNVQLMGYSSSFKIVEVNPRVAGSLSLIMASGLNYIDLIIKVFTGQTISKEELNYTPGIIMTRYNEEIFLKPETVISVA
jgi:carbamoyl-phosphate synthase large subunit